MSRARTIQNYFRTCSLCATKLKKKICKGEGKRQDSFRECRWLLIIFVFEKKNN